jgi:nucleoid-associated protein YgaU
MGIFDKAGSIFGDKPEEEKKTGASPDFRDTSSGNTAGRPSAADFSDVTSGASTATPADSSRTTYTVQSGDSLSKIAKAQYGDASKWRLIYEANRDKISNPDLIHPGQEFTIPDA